MRALVKVLSHWYCMAPLASSAALHPMRQNPFRMAEQPVPWWVLSRDGTDTHSNQETEQTTTSTWLSTWWCMSMQNNNNCSQDSKTSAAMWMTLIVQFMSGGTLAIHIHWGWQKRMGNNMMKEMQPQMCCCFSTMLPDNAHLLVLLQPDVPIFLPSLLQSQNFS